MASRTPSVKWTREQTLIAINLYCKLPFGKLHKTNPIIVGVAEKMGRTASSLRMKLCNFASLDPVQSARGIARVPLARGFAREWPSQCTGGSNLPPVADDSERRVGRSSVAMNRDLELTSVSVASPKAAPATVIRRNF